MNNLLSNDVGVEKRFYQINDYNLLPKLEKIINKENEDNELKTYTATIINQIKIYKIYKWSHEILLIQNHNFCKRNN